MDEDDPNHTFLNAALNQQRAAIGTARMYLDDVPEADRDPAAAAIAAEVIAAADTLVERMRARLQEPS